MPLPHRRGGRAHRGGVDVPHEGGEGGGGGLGVGPELKEQRPVGEEGRWDGGRRPDPPPPGQFTYTIFIIPDK